MCERACVCVCVCVCERVCECVWKRGRMYKKADSAESRQCGERVRERDRDRESERDLFRQNFSVVIRACLEPTSNPVSLWQRPTTDEDLKKLPPPIFFLKKKSF